MGRGFLAGTFWGGLIGVIMLFVSSQVMDRQQLSLPQPSAAPVEVPAGTEFDQARPETDPVIPTPEDTPAAEAVAGVTPPAETEQTPPALDTAAADVPSTSVDSPGGLGDAPQSVSNPEVAANGAASTTANPVQGALAVPDNPVGAPSTSTNAPDTAAAPSQADDTTTSVSNAGDETQTSSQGDGLFSAQAPQSPTTEMDAPADVAALAPSDTQAPQMAAPAGGSDAAVALPGAGDSSPSTESAPQVGDVSPVMPGVQFGSSGIETQEAPAPAPQVVETVETTEPETVETAETGPEAGPEPEQPQAPSASEPVNAFIATLPNVIYSQEPEAPTVSSAEGSPTVEDAPASPAAELEVAQADTEPRNQGRLPVVRRQGQIVEEPTEEAVEAPAPDADVVETAEETDEADGPAMDRNSVAFDNPGNLPLLSLVLVQDGPTLDASVLETLPMGVAFAIDAGMADAGQIAEFYKTAGREVVMIPSLPRGARPQDVEVALQSNFDTIPSAVAIIDINGDGFQADREAVAQVVDVAAATGHGLITFPRGLNTAHQRAGRAGVPRGLIFRNIDGSSETSAQIQRALDRAAFRARQNDAVILVGRTAPETIEALQDWVSGGRSGDVVMAPVSAALGGDS